MLYLVLPLVLTGWSVGALAGSDQPGRIVEADMTAFVSISTEHGTEPLFPSDSSSDTALSTVPARRGVPGIGVPGDQPSELMIDVTARWPVRTVDTSLVGKAVILLGPVPTVEAVSEDEIGKVGLAAETDEIDDFESIDDRESVGEQEGSGEDDKPASMQGITNDYYVVERGDTLTAIARRLDVPIQVLAEENGIRNYNLIYTNQSLRIPHTGDRQ